MDILGIPIPDAGPVFLTTLAIHVPAGLACVISGAAAALTRKGGAAHQRFGRMYVWGLAVVFGTMTVMSVIRWRENAHLFLIGVAAFTAGCVGYLDRHMRLSDRVHIMCMGVSYVALLTAFYVDNGPHLPLWDRLPTWALWLLPSLVGLLIISRAIKARRRAS